VFPSVSCLFQSPTVHRWSPLSRSPFFTSPFREFCALFFEGFLPLRAVPFLCISCRSQLLPESPLAWAELMCRGSILPSKRPLLSREGLLRVLLPSTPFLVFFLEASCQSFLPSGRRCLGWSHRSGCCCPCSRTVSSPLAAVLPLLPPRLIPTLFSSPVAVISFPFP